MQPIYLTDRIVTEVLLWRGINYILKYVVGMLEVQKKLKG